MERTRRTNSGNDARNLEHTSTRSQRPRAVHDECDKRDERDRRLCRGSGNATSGNSRPDDDPGDERKEEGKPSFGHPPMRPVYTLGFFVSRPFVSYDVRDLSSLLLFGPNSTIRVIVREARVGDLHKREEEERGKRATKAEEEEG